jgi:hypothetical protein
MDAAFSGSNDDADTNWAAARAVGDVDNAPHAGHYLFEAPGFVLNEFLADCDA